MIQRAFWFYVVYVYGCLMPLIRAARSKVLGCTQFVGDKEGVNPNPSPIISKSYLFIFDLMAASAAPATGQLAKPTIHAAATV